MTARGDAMSDKDLPHITHVHLNPTWLAQYSEDPLEPALPIVDPHHHLWDRAGGYLLDELLADTGSGHNVVATVFVQCGYAYRTTGPDELKSLGETEFVTASRASRNAGRRRPAPSPASSALWTSPLGDKAGRRPARAYRGRRRPLQGIRHITALARRMQREPAWTVRRRADSADPDFRAGFALLGKLGLSFDAWLYHPQFPELDRPRTRVPGDPDRARPRRRTAGRRALRRPARPSIPRMDRRRCGPGRLPERRA